MPPPGQVRSPDGSRVIPHWHLHFIPTHSSWLNQLERFFALITMIGFVANPPKTFPTSNRPSSITSKTKKDDSNHSAGPPPLTPFPERLQQYAKNFDDSPLPHLSRSRLRGAVPVLTEGDSSLHLALEKPRRWECTKSRSPLIRRPRARCG